MKNSQNNGRALAEALTVAQLEATIDALTFCLADDWDISSHEHSQPVYERALSKLLSLRGRIIGVSLSNPTTPPDIDGAEVIQADREAAACYLDLQGDHDIDAAVIISGNGDHKNLVRAFAAHRRAYTPKPTATPSIDLRAALAPADRVGNKNNA